MRPQVVVLGPIERELYVRLDEDLLPDGTKRAEEISFRTGGAGVAISERLTRLGLSTALLLSAGASPETKELLGSLKRRGVRTRALQSSTRATPFTVTVRTPRHELRMLAPPPVASLSEEALGRALRGCRHFHLCGSSMTDGRMLDSAKHGLKHAQRLGESTSLDVSDADPTSTAWAPLLRHVDVLFGASTTLRALAGEARLGAAAARIQTLGVGTIAVELGAGGCRVYARGDVRRVPALGDGGHNNQTGVFPSGFLLGWLLGASSAVCGLFGNALLLPDRDRRPPDRRELRVRLSRARTNPHFRKLVPDMQEGQRLLARPRRLPPRRRTQDFRLSPT